MMSLQHHQDLNSVLSSTQHNLPIPRNALRNQQHRYHQLQTIQPQVEKSRIAHWDPHELAAKITSQVDIEQLIKDKIVRKPQLETFEISAFQEHAIHSPEYVQNERVANFLRKNPIDIGDLGFKNSAC